MINVFRASLFAENPTVKYEAAWK